MNNEFIENPTDLSLLLARADTEDLGILVDYITDKGEGRISLNDDVCKRLVHCKRSGTYQEADRAFIAYELRRFGGNTLANVYRDVRNAIPAGSFLDGMLPDTSRSVEYDEIVRDVAQHLGVAFNKGTDLITVEDGILRKILSDSFEKMSAEERKAILKELNVSDLSLLKPASTAALIAAGKAGGFATYKLAVIVANAIAKVLLGRAIPFAGYQMLTKTLSIAMGPVGWVVTGLWAMADMASPAYRVIVPCVIQVAYMRQKAIAKALAVECGKCSALSGIGSKFCSECGNALETN